MILVSCSIAQAEIINMICEYKIDGEYIFKHIKTDGIRIYFETKLNESYEACNIISNLIKTHKYGHIIFYNVVPIFNNKVKWI